MSHTPKRTTFFQPVEDDLTPHTPEPDFTSADGALSIDSQSYLDARSGRTKDGAQQNAVQAIVAAQRVVAASVVRDASLFDVVCNSLRPSDFDDALSAALYRGVCDILEGHVPGIKHADLITVSTLESVSKVASLQTIEALEFLDADDAGRLEGYVSLIREHGASKSLERAMAKATEVAQGEGDAESRAQAIQEIVQGSQSTNKSSVISLGQAAIQAVSELARTAAAGKPALGVPTGFGDLDLLTAGLHPGQLIILGARPAMGKTALAVSIGLYASIFAGVGVLMASMEMHAQELAKRAASIVSGVPGQAVRTASMTEKQWDDLVVGTDFLDTLPFMVTDIPGLRLAALRAEARRLKRESRLGLIVVDYLQIMTPSGTSNIREQQISEISRGLKLLAMELKVPVLVLSQLNRLIEQREDRRPKLSDLRESGSLEQDADIVLFLHREDMVKRVGSGTGLAEIIVAKQRAGATGDVVVGFDDATTKFFDLSNPDALRARQTSDALRVLNQPPANSSLLLAA